MSIAPHFTSTKENVVLQPLRQIFSAYVEVYATCILRTVVRTRDLFLCTSNKIPSDSRATKDIIVIDGAAGAMQPLVLGSLLVQLILMMKNKT